MPLDLEAIDFRKLLSEERKKKGIKKKTKAQGDEACAADNEESSDPQLPPHAIHDNAAQSASSASLNMVDAIDFKALMREERKKNKHKKTANATKVQNDSTSKDASSHSNSVKQLPEWTHQPEFLAMNALNLEKICDNPSNISYSPTTFQASSQDALQAWLQSLPSGDSGLGEWKTMNFGKRRVCMFGEMRSDNGTIPAPLPTPLNELAQELVTQSIFPASTPPNHVLLNEYQPGQGIMPHTDGPMYENRTATLSLSSSVVMEFTKRRRGDDDTAVEQPLPVLLQPGSLLVFTDDAYINYCHGITMDTLEDVIARDRLLNASVVGGDAIEINVPRELRYSLTFRHKKWETE